MYAEPNYVVRRHNANILSLFGESQNTFSKGMDVKDNLKPDLALKVENPKKELSKEDEDVDKKMLLDKACSPEDKMTLEKSDDECSHEELKDRIAQLRAMKK